VQHTKILFCISDTGGGHRAGAVAIDAALEQAVGNRVERTIIDLLASTDTPFVKSAPELYDKLSTRWLPMYDLLFRLTDGSRRIGLLSRLVWVRARQHIVRQLQTLDPDLVVSVHPLANRLIASARRAGRLKFRFVIVVTDLVSLHASWGYPEADLCIVPTKEAYQRLIRRRMPRHKLVQTGFPVHPKFADLCVTKTEARRQLSIDTSAFTLLVTGGGVGSGNLVEQVVDLHQTHPNTQLLVVTGKNKAVQTQLTALNLGTNVHIYGFVNNMEWLMAASDLVVTKAGPGTLMETLVVGRPPLVTQAVGFQERGNIDFVLNHELGAYCPTFERLNDAISELQQPDRYNATVQRLQQVVPRNGAQRITQILLEQLQLDPPSLKRRRRRLLSSWLH
jgi:UDP-N-acetylglucosamine:LPS N-acetylglucosamine transferase